MISKVKGIVLVVIISLASIMMPFTVYADTITNSNVNINYYLDSVAEISSGSYMQTYKVEFVFDQSYLGWISSKMVGTYINNNTVPITTSQFTKTQAIYVNGSIAETSFSFITPNSQNGGALQSLSQSIQNSNVSPLADLSTLDDILNILIDINNNIEIDVLDELQDIVSNTSLSNTYLETISKFRKYDFPVESLSFNMYLDKYYQPTDLFSDYQYTYPIYEIQTNSYIYQYTPSTIENRCFILFINGNVYGSRIPTNFVVTEGTIVNNKSLRQVVYDGVAGYFIYFEVKSTTNNPVRVQFTNAVGIINPKIIGIYTDFVSNNVSTDFALNWGLSNDLLKNIQIIANGTNQSNSAASDLENEASEYSDIADDVIGVEEGLTSNFETEVNKIDLNTGLNVFGGNFMTSATWVRTQFDRLTENTPYGSLVVYGLTLGFVLLMLGKVLL